MIKSMTGYGKAEAALGHKKITVEIRSLNSKQTDLAVKLPALYRPQEYEIRNGCKGVKSTSILQWSWPGARIPLRSTNRPSTNITRS